jgi:FecR protein
MPRLAPLVSTALISLCVPLIAAAQEPAADAPAHISVVDGAALLERDGRSESAPSSMPLLAGDRVRTQNGRVEILYGDGSTLHLDANTLVDFQSDEVIRLLEGRIRLSIAGPRRQVDYRVDAPSGWVQIPTPGEYRIAVIPGERDADLAVCLQLRQLGCVRSLVGSAARHTPWRLGGISSGERSVVLVDVQQLRLLAERTDLRLRLVSARGPGLAALLLRPLDDAAAVGLDVDRHGSLGLADASLRPLGFQRRQLVLDSRAHLGRRVGVVGVRARLCELVSAGLGQPSGLRLQLRQRASGLSTQSVARLDGGAAPPVRIGIRQRPRRELDAD